MKRSVTQDYSRVVQQSTDPLLSYRNWKSTSFCKLFMSASGKTEVQSWEISSLFKQISDFSAVRLETGHHRIIFSVNFAAELFMTTKIAWATPISVSVFVWKYPFQPFSVD